MATANPLTASPNPVPTGGTGLVTASFAVAPGTPDANTTVELRQNGVLKQSQTVVIKGQPAEATPSVVVNGQTGSGWELRLVQDPNVPGVGKLVAGSSPNTATVSS